MNSLSQKITLLIVATATFLGSISIGFGEEMNYNREHADIFYDPAEIEQSFLYRFLRTHLALKIIAKLAEENDLCNYCTIRDQYHLTFPDGSPDYLKELEISEVSPRDFCRDFWSLLTFEKKADENCNLCELFKKFPFFGLCDDIINELKKDAYLLLKEQDPEKAEALNQFFEFNFKSSKKDNDLNKKLIYEIEKIGHIPNTSDSLVLFSNVLNDVLSSIQNVEVHDRMEVRKASQVWSFATILGKHKKYIDENIEILMQIETIVKKRRQLGDDGRKMKIVADIMTELKRIKNLYDSPEFQKKLEQVLKDLL